MRKRELRKRMGLTVTAEMQNTAENDKEIEMPYYGRTIKRRTFEEYIRADVQNGILAVYIFHAADILAKKPDPAITVYMDKKTTDHITWGNVEEKWYTAKMETLRQYRYSGKGIKSLQRVWEEPKSAGVVRRYFGDKEGHGIADLVKNFQKKTEERRLKQKHDAEKERIDEVMEKCPPVPEGAAEWARKHHLDHFLIYRRSEDRALCTCCKKEMKLSTVDEYMNGLEPWMDGYKEDGNYRVKEKDTVFCPRCLKKVQAESWERSKTLFRQKDIEVFRKLATGEGWVISHVNVSEMDSLSAGKWKVGKVRALEYERAVVDKEGTRTGRYEWTHFKGRNEVRWCRQLVTDMYGRRVAPTWHNSADRLYPGTLKEAEKGTPLEHTRWKDYAKDYSIPTIIEKCVKIPGMEYLHKNGMERLERNILNTRLEELNAYMNFPKAGEKPPIWDMLGLDRNRFERMKRIDGGIATALVLKTGEKISESCLKKLTCEMVFIHQIQDLINCAERTGMSIEKTYNYITKQNETVGRYKDYLDMAQDLGMPLHDDIVRRPRNVRERHDALVDETREKREKDRCKKEDARFKDISKNRKRNEKLLSWENEKYIIFPAKKASDLIREGRALHHCVGSSDSYMRKMNEDKTFICMLRKKNKEKTPYYTLEVDRSGEVLQWYSEFDRKPDKKKIAPLIKTYEKEVEKRMEEMQWSS